MLGIKTGKDARKIHVSKFFLNTVESRYLELGYLEKLGYLEEIPISPRFPIGLVSNYSLSRTIRYLERSFLPLKEKTRLSQTVSDKNFQSLIIKAIIIHFSILS